MHHHFYPRSPCGERHGFPAGNLCPVRFLSTLSLRRATHTRRANRRSPHHFYPRSPCGERLPVFSWRCPLTYFYPRSPCGERLTVSTLKILAILFLSTLSLRRATAVCANVRAPRLDFYPRSPCGERLSRQISIPPAKNFYPRSPCGERPNKWNWNYIRALFLSTLSLRRATCSKFPLGQSGARFLSTLSLRRATFMLLTSFLSLGEFLSTLSLRRATYVAIYIILLHSNFYPRSPCGERRGSDKYKGQALEFLSTLSLRRATVLFHALRQQLHISIHALLAESDPSTQVSPPGKARFLSTLSLRRATRIPR